MLVGMARKAIAAMLLVAIAAWTELALAPMLTMPGGHMHRGHWLVAEVTSQSIADDHAAAARSAKHACCPPAIRHAKRPGTLEFVANSSDCQGSHRCCFRQGPQPVPAPATEIRFSGPQIFAVVAPQVDQPANGFQIVFAPAPVASPPYLQIFGVTLRI
jgi:hypothetical protein